MLAVGDAEKIETIVAEEAQTPAQNGKLVDIDKKIVNAVAQLVPDRSEAAVDDGAMIEARD